jgi:hypothetical protein
VDIDSNAVDRLFQNEAEALEQWYRGYLGPTDPDAYLTGGPSIPNFDRILEMFQAWLNKNRDQLREIVCKNPRVIDLNKGLGAGKLEVIAAVAVVISQHYLGEVDAIATAVLIVARHGLQSLCAD